MAIVFDPSSMLKKVASRAKIKRMVSSRMSVKRTILAHIPENLGVDSSTVTEVARKTLMGYRKRMADAVIENDLDKSAGSALKKELIADPRQLIQRVQNEIVFQVHKGIKEKYAGKKARWLPSSAEEPRPEHQKAYGQVYTIGEGLPVGDSGDNVEPGDDYGCQCGVEILIDETTLDLS